MRQTKLFFILALLCAVAQGAWAADRNYEYPTKTKPQFYASYDGKSNVVVINTPAELAYITANFSESSGYDGDKAWSELNYYLNADLDMGSTYSWLPMGRESYNVTSYSGTFWGNGHTINYRILSLDEMYEGLFSIIDREGKVYDVNVVCDIYADARNVGGIAGENRGLIQNCTVTCHIENYADYTGGIVGRNDWNGIVTGCHVMGTIMGRSSAIEVGGICGDNKTQSGADGAVISNCWVEADVISENSSWSDAFVGGICGANTQKINYCCMTGNVINTGESPGVGGLIGTNNTGGEASHSTFYGTVTVSHEQTSKYIGYNTSYVNNLYDSFNQSEYDAAIAAGYTLYAYALKNAYTVSAATNGLGTIRISAGDVDNITRWRPGETITVTTEPGTKIDGIDIRDADNNTVPYSNLTANGFTFTMPRRHVDVIVYFDVPDWPTQGTGTEADPYLITSVADWNGFAYNVVYGNAFSGQYVKLTENISMTTIAGRDSYTPFEGIFDGGGHTLTFTKGSSEHAFNEEYCAPFCCVRDGTIKNLHIAGTITTSAPNAGGLVGHSLGDVTITNCVSSVTINSSVSGEGRHGGLVGSLESFQNHVTISGCVFDGTFATTSGTTGCSGFIGYTWYSAPTILNSVMKPASVAAGMLVKTFADWQSTFEPTVINCYYVGTTNLPGNQGKQSHTITAGDEYTTIEAVTPVGEKFATYDVAGINAYLSYYATSPIDFVNGLACGSTAYCGNGDEVGLTLTNNHPSPGENLQYTYTSSAGTLSGNTLLMPDADVTISVDEDHPVALDWALVSTGTQDDPYRIYTAEQLNLLAQRVNNGTKYAGKYFTLMNDIEYSHTTDWDDATSTENNFTPIGKDIVYSFCGYFDGNGHTISGIRIYKPNDQKLGLFGYIDWGYSTFGAIIHDLTLADTRITGNQAVGGIAGVNAGDDNHGSTVTRCHVAANVAIHAVKRGGYPNKEYGGIVGYSFLSATVSLCTSAVTIIADDGCTYFGAIVGHNEQGTLSYNLAIRATIPSAADNTHGAICGMNESGSLLRNYYVDCTVAGTPSATHVGCSGADITANNGAVRAYALASAPANLGSLVQDYGTLEAYANGFLYGGMYYVTPASISLADNADSGTTISNADGYLANVTLQGRTLYKDGAWNTLCLPFDVALSGSPLEGAVVRPLTSASIEGSTLNLEFGNAVDELEAGTPYIIKWTAAADYEDDDAHNLVSPVFNGVTIDATDRSYDNNVSGDLRVRFLGTYASQSFDAEDKSILLMGSANTLYYPTTGAGIGAQRAYFKIGDDGTAGARQLTAFSIDFGDGETTGIIEVHGSGFMVHDFDAWYTLDGRRLAQKPSRAGVYINNGVKRVIK